MMKLTSDDLDRLTEIGGKCADAADEIRHWRGANQPEDHDNAAVVECSHCHTKYNAVKCGGHRCRNCGNFIKQLPEICKHHPKHISLVFSNRTVVCSNCGKVFKDVDFNSISKVISDDYTRGNR